MKVGTDACLLGAWAPCNQARHILDIGTGTGVIALMLAQRQPLAAVHAVELESAAAAQAAANFAQSPWANRIELHELAIQQYYPAQLFDCIVSNPPFYPTADFSEAKEENRRMARSTHKLPYEDLLQSVARLLTDDGTFHLILPIELGAVFNQLANENGLYCSGRTTLRPQPAKDCNRLLLSYSKNQTAVVLMEEILIRTNPQVAHAYSPRYQELLQDFLIIF